MPSSDAARTGRQGPLDLAALDIAIHLRTGRIPDDDTMRETCATIALMVTALKTYGRVYHPSVRDPRSGITYVAKVHAGWTGRVAPRLSAHLMMSSSFYDAIMEQDDDVTITAAVPNFKPLKLHLVCDSTDAGPVSAAPVEKRSVPEAAARVPPAAAARGDASGPASPTGADSRCRAGGGGGDVVVKYRCRTCATKYSSPVNAARCAATHPPAGSQQGRRSYDAAAVARFWDSLGIVARIDLLEAVVPLVSTGIMRKTGAELLEAMDDDDVCEKLLLVMLHPDQQPPAAVTVEELDSLDCVAAHTYYLVIDVIIKAMEAAAAAREEELLALLDAEATRAATREASRQAKRVAREAARHQKTLDRLATDDAFFRAFTPGCVQHWWCEDV